jgi:4-carboxymuconolactone decarboxylase
MSTSTRYDSGLATLKQVGGADYDGPLNQLKDVAPDLARFTVEFCYGDIMSRSELDLQTRQLSTVAALAAMGNAQPQLRYHIAGALNVGCEPEAVIEVIMLCAVFAGFPAAGNAILVAKDVLADRGCSFQPVMQAPSDNRYATGMAALEAISAGAGKNVTQSLMGIAPDLARFVIEFSYGDILSRTVINHRTKELAIVAMLTALGTAQPQLKVHISAALNVGATPVEVTGVIQQMAVYAGFPAALNGIFAAKDIFSRLNDATHND